jgi:hypothetical protein
VHGLHSYSPSEPTLELFIEFRVMIFLYNIVKKETSRISNWVDCSNTIAIFLYNIVKKEASRISNWVDCSNTIAIAAH